MGRAGRWTFNHSTSAAGRRLGYDLSFMHERHVQAELMDDPSLDPSTHNDALIGLRRLNRLSQSAGAIWPALRDVQTQSGAKRALRVLDIATGSGDTPVRIFQLARENGVDLHLAGCDVSETALATARAYASGQKAEVEFFQLDVLRDPLPGDYDVIVCSLFLHHLSDEQGLRLLREMRRSARCRVIINDLERTRLNLAMVWLGARIVTRSHVVHIDGPRSVRAAFSRREALALANQAGMNSVQMKRLIPCRYQMTWDKER